MKPLKILPAAAPAAASGHSALTTQDSAPTCGTTAARCDPMTIDLNTLSGSELVKLRNEFEMALTRAHDAGNFEAVARLRVRRDEIQELIVQLEW